MAFPSLHSLLLCNVYSANSGVSSPCHFIPQFSSFSTKPASLKHLSVSFCDFRPQAAANFYQRALLANALTSALRLHQRLPRFQLSRAFLAQALQEDSCHYLLYSLILVNSYPITSILHFTWFSYQVSSNIMLFYC